MSRKINIFTSLSAFSCADADANALFAKAEFSEASLAAWLSAIGKTYNEVRSAVCSHFTSLKNDGLWNKGGNDAYYLPIGNTSTQRKFNVYNPNDSDAAFRLSFNGGITFTNFGIKGNGVNGWTDTFWNANSFASSTAAAFAIDSEDNITGGNQIMGVFLTSGTSRMWVNLGATPSGNIQIANINAIFYTGTRKGLFFSRRSGAAFNESYRDSSSLGTTAATFSPSLFNFYLNALNNNGTPTFFAQHGVRMALLSGGDYSDADKTAFELHYNNFKTELGIV